MDKERLTGLAQRPSRQGTNSLQNSSKQLQKALTGLTSFKRGAGIIPDRLEQADESKAQKNR